MFNRRDFARLAALSGFALTGIGKAVARPAHSKDSMATDRLKLIKPPKLSVGDTLGMPLPARMAFEPSRIDMAKRQLEALGFEVKLGANAYARGTYLAGTDEQRADDINSMFADDSVDGIICFTGGWGTPRILPLLDYELIRTHPKVLMGFSDVTALINGVHEKTGLVTFHGPVADTTLRPWTVEQMERVIMSDQPIGTLSNPPKPEDALINHDFRILTLRGGKARGPLIGGNMTMICSLMGTPWEVNTDGAILLLEDIHEDTYRVDRMFTQLSLGGKLDKVAGVAFGYCTECDPGRGPGFSFEQVLHHWLEPLGVPAVAGLAFGHLKEKLTLPLGLEGTLDADTGTLSFDEAAVT